MATRLDKLRDIVTQPVEFCRRLPIVARNFRRQPLTPLGRAQAELIRAVAEYPDVIVIKDRKRGITTATLAALFWVMYTARDEEALVSVTHAADATETANRILALFMEPGPHALPDAIRPIDVHVTAEEITMRVPDLVRDLLGHPRNAGTLRFAQRTAGGKSQGRSFTYSHTHFTEVAFYTEGSASVGKQSNADGNDRVSYGSWRNSVPDHPRRRNVVESTGHGSGGLFHELKKRSDDYPDEWKRLFFPWFYDDLYTKPVPSHFALTDDEKKLLQLHAHAGLTIPHLAFRRWKISQGSSEDTFRREFPSTVEEPFLLSGSGYFPSTILNELRAFADTERCPARQELVILEEPLAGYRYAIGADTSGGVGKDFAYFNVTRDDGKQVARFRSNRTAPVAQGDMLAKLSTKYGRALVLVEANNHGKAVIERCRELNVNLWTKDGKYFSSQRREAGGTKPLVLALGRDLLEQGFFNPPSPGEPWVSDEVVLAELISMKDDGTGNVTAPGDDHDDSAMGFLLSLWCARDIFRGVKRGLPEPRPQVRLQDLDRLWK